MAFCWQKKMRHVTIQCLTVSGKCKFDPMSEVCVLIVHIDVNKKNRHDHITKSWFRFVHIEVIFVNLFLLILIQKRTQFCYKIRNNAIKLSYTCIFMHTVYMRISCSLMTSICIFTSCNFLVSLRGIHLYKYTC